LNVYGTPHLIKPREPIAAKTPPTGEGWLHEPKLDGYRLQVIKDGGQVRLYSRGAKAAQGHDHGAQGETRAKG
jgi:ATP-dependent DNA ligase